jgi:hypothetical protein
MSVNEDLRGSALRELHLSFSAASVLMIPDILRARQVFFSLPHRLRTRD